MHDNLTQIFRAQKISLKRSFSNRYRKSYGVIYTFLAIVVLVLLFAKFGLFSERMFQGQEDSGAANNVAQVFLKNDFNSRNEKLLRRLVREAPRSSLHGISTSKYENEYCQALNYNGAKSDVNMTSVYDVLKFDNPNGGVWKQGFPITTSDEEWKGRKLKVFVVPHSHNDPGWGKTYINYYLTQTQYIITTIINSLNADPKRRFIWAEISFFTLWWEESGDEMKNKAMKVIRNGQLEFVTGGWVMNDEANTHYFAMIDQMIEGHEWLSRNLGVKVRSGWAIDPFGHTPTMAYLLKRMKFENMLIQRVHYSVKKHFAKKKLLEFRWRQSWDTDDSTDITCHMMPFDQYDIPDTCGPDKKICCQFDFTKLTLNSYCEWGVQPVAISQENVAERSATLLDQYRKKAKLFKTDTLLVILGGDFKYAREIDLESQFQNYRAIFDFVNSHPELNAELQFGTLSEYFDAMKKELGGEQKLPALVGDFFTYADKNDEYWSGYYTSRPFYKRQERILEAHIRGAEIIFSLAVARLNDENIGNTLKTLLYPDLVKARANLGLFQHHDGITGTSNTYVMSDYGSRLMTSIMSMKRIISSSSQLLLTKSTSMYNAEVHVISLDSMYAEEDRMPAYDIISLNEGDNCVVIYNSLSHRRTGLVRLQVSSFDVIVESSDKEVIPSQVNQIWMSALDTRQDLFEVIFAADVPAMGLATYNIRLARGMTESTTYSSTFIVNAHKLSGKEKLRRSPFTIHMKEGDLHSDFKLENNHLTLYFSQKTGLLNAIKPVKDTEKIPVHIDFGVYTARDHVFTSGMYLFLPEGKAAPYLNPEEKPIIRIISGPLLKEVHVLTSNFFHKISLENTDHVSAMGIHVYNEVDVRSNMDNKEISMRITAPSIMSGDTFFTDLNGFQIQRRKRMLEKLPIQAHFFPMPAMAFIQDKIYRLTVLTGQPLGVSSLQSGQLEVILDRRLMQDDNRGIGQALKDNVLTADSFFILLEKWKSPRSDRMMNSPMQYPSLLAHQASLRLLHPLWSQRFSLEPSEVKKDYFDKFEPESSVPCDLHVVNLRSIEAKYLTLPTNESALILQRFGYECQLNALGEYVTSCSSTKRKTKMGVKLSNILPIKKARETSLSMQYTESKTINPDSEVNIAAMEIKTFKVELHSVKRRSDFRKERPR